MAYKYENVGGKMDRQAMCANRQLSWILIASTIQTTILIVLGFSLLVTYENHKHDFESVGNIAWADIAESVNYQYQSLDKDILKDILNDAKNTTISAKKIVNNDVAGTVKDARVVMNSVMKNVYVIDSVKKMIHDVQKPIDVVVEGITPELMSDIQQTVKLTNKMLKNMDDVHLPNLMAKLTTALAGVLTKENVKTFHDLAKDTDNSIKSSEEFVSVVKSLNKK